ncbi:phosphatidylinositol glycan, class F [Cryptococcus neoformans Bt63]|nr:phosphatidylinositol glycan, class F [Cryptococcus neoformans var. grubii Bt63]
MAPALPLPEYFTLLIYLAILLIAAFISLPHSTSYFLSAPLAQSSSADRPEHPFLTPITSRPLITMAWDVIGVGMIMFWWGGKMKGWWEGKSAAKKEEVVGESDMEERTSRTTKMFTRFKEAGMATAGMAGVYYLFLSLMGAPLNSHFPHSLLLALHLSILTVWAPVYSLGIPSMYDQGINARFRMTRLFCQFQPENPIERALVYPVIGTFVGAWIGAIPIALDWDRPWQSYPLTVALASILGFLVGGFASWTHSIVEDMYEEVNAGGNVKENEKRGKKKNKKKSIAA